MRRKSREDTANSAQVRQLLDCHCHNLLLLLIPLRLNVLTLRRKAGAVFSAGPDQSLKKMKQKISNHLFCHLLGPGSAWTSPSAQHIGPVNSEKRLLNTALKWIISQLLVQLLLSLFHTDHPQV